MVPKSPEPSESLDHLFGEKDDLVFLRDEGLELLAQHKRIRNKDKRRLAAELIRMLAEDQPKL